MVQIINDPSRWSSLGASLGRGLGSGLGVLAAKKLNDVNMRRQQSQMEQQRMQNMNAFQALGYNPSDASILSSFPANLQMAYMKEFAPPEMQQVMQRLQGNQQAPGLSQLNALGGPQQEQQPIQQVMQRLQDNQQALGIPQLNALGGLQQEQQPMQQVMQGSDQQQQIQPERRMTTTQRIKSEQMARRKEFEDRKLVAQQTKEDRAHQYHIDVETKEIYKEINEKAEGAYEADRRINRMEVLVNKGDLTRPRWHALLKTLSKGVMGHGINLHSLETADSQEFLKLSQEFLKDVKKIFGSKITNMEIENFLKMIPSLSQSKEGKLRIINNMRLYNEGSLAKKKAMDDIIAENNGNRPMNLSSMVEKRSKSALDLIAKRIAIGYKPGQELKQSPGIMSTLLDPLSALPDINPLDVIFGEG